MVGVFVVILLLVTPQALISAELLHADEPTDDPPKIAVVGGGIGGTSSAFFLQELFGGSVIVDVYEPGHIGGRLATLPIANHQYEIGGSIIHPRNRYMVELASKFGLKPKGGCDMRMGLFNGKEFVYRDSSWFAISIAKLFWRYGMSAYSLVKLTENLLGKFERIYQLQAEGHAYKNVSGLISAMDPVLAEMMHMSSEEWLRGHGFSQLMIDELVTAVNQANYGQTPTIQAFVGAVSVAGADSNLWSVLGGNKRVAEELLKASRAAHLSRKVTQISSTEDGRFMVTSLEDDDDDDNKLFREGNTANTASNQDSDPSEETARTQDYDIVIIATPLTTDKSDLKLVNFTQKFSFPGRYEKIVCSMIQGNLNPVALNLDKDDPISEILVANPKLFFNAIGKQNPADSAECSEDLPVWKVFSPLQLTDKQLDAFFPQRKSVNVIDWLAYPHYESHSEAGNFELTPGLYYINAIEWASSAMEMSVIGGKNTALLAYKHWMKDPNAGSHKQSRDEL